jgi:hypothetical protein
MKAAVVLKQDIELLARFHELANDRTLRRTPNVACGPDGSGQVYGKLNEVAHPSSLEAMGTVLASLDGNLSILPVRKVDIEAVLFHWHGWTCVEFARATV